ncbi:MAG TPA: hypothetical protein DCX07_07070 [Phycisphaerales bacterium]|nr:hypothetical protein [Phycisphaerales bacterium]
MTFRILITGLIGFACAMFIAAFGYLNDSPLRLTYLVGNHLPIFVFGLLILIAALINPLLALLHRSIRLRPAELAIIVAMMLVACSIPGSGLMRTFTTALAMPIHHNQTSASWQKNGVLEMVPPRMLPAGGRYDKQVMDGFLSGALSSRDRPLFDTTVVPWKQWAQPLGTWTPLLVLMAVGVICLSLVVHRQWASRERLRYPIADFATSLTAQEPDRIVGPMFRNRLFWIGLAVIFLIHVVNGLATWFPTQGVKIPLQVEMPQIAQKWPALGRAAGAWGLFNPKLYPTVAAFAFFLASDVSFSLGLTQILYVPLMAALIVAGVDTSADYFTGGPTRYQLFGSYLGVALILLYTGRRYYWQTVKQAFTFRRQEGVERYAAWAMRILLLCAAGAVAVMTGWMELDLPFAILVVLLVLMTFLVMARINAETGLFFCQPHWQPVGVLVGLFGWTALGPKALLVAGVICSMLTIDPRECLMPFVVNGLKMCDTSQVRPGRMGWVMAVVFVVGLSLAIPVVLGSNYARGITATDGWATNNVPKFAFDATARQMDKLRVEGELDRSMAMTTWQRIRNASPETSFLLWGGVGLGLVLVFSYLRLRFTWWPIHPVLFLVWGFYPLQNFSSSFLLGWLIKVVVTKLGGGRKYRQLQPLMVGVIAGDLLGGLLWMGVGAGYYAILHKVPQYKYIIFPG